MSRWTQRAICTPELPEGLGWTWKWPEIAPWFGVFPMPAQLPWSLSPESTSILNDLNTKSLPSLGLLPGSLTQVILDSSCVSVSAWDFRTWSWEVESVLGCICCCWGWERRKLTHRKQQRQHWRVTARPSAALQASQDLSKGVVETEDVIQVVQLGSCHSHPWKSQPVSWKLKSSQMLQMLSKENSTVTPDCACSFWGAHS